MVKHPIEDWSALEDYEPPDISKSERGDRDWKKIKAWIEERRRAGLITVGDDERLFDRLYFLRGFKNLMLDIAKDAPQLPRLIKMLEDHEMRLVKNGWR
ncbi:MAG: hypothetical protein ACUVTL_08790 [Thermoproteota archaeon]